MSRAEAIPNGKVVSLECSGAKTNNIGKDIYYISVIIKSSKWGFGRWFYDVTPVAGSGVFRISEERIVRGE